uniref:Steryl-sulfatase-like n=1 Tax=Saccoglossus kowalevskii TaxID=10224 RepID=A0ABM0MX51_SACKO
MGDVGCFGNDTIHTPNIDSIARQGVKFSHHVIPAPLCSPSRAAFITGRHPVRSGMLGYGRLRMVPFLAATAGLPPNETTFAEVLKDVGYKTGLVGKWHMGLHCENRQDFCHHPLKQGFDFYYGLPLTNLRDCGEDATRSVITARIPQMTEILALSMVIVVVTLVAFTKIGLIQRRGFIFLLAVSFIIFATPVVLQKGLRRINCILMKNYDVVEQPVILENMTLRITQQSMQFLKSSQNEAFLLYVSFLKVHTALFSSSKFKGISKHGNYGDNVEEMDWSVGKILSTLEELGLKENTFVYLTSDNGGHLEEIASDGQREGGHNGIYRGGKAQVWEGGLRVPTVAMYPGVIPPSTEVMQPT